MGLIFRSVVRTGLRRRAVRRGGFTALVCSLLLAASCTGGTIDSGAGGSVGATAFRWWNGPWGSTVSYNPYVAGYVGDAFNLVLLPLAYTLPAPDKFGTYYP